MVLAQNLQKSVLQNRPNTTKAEASKTLCTSCYCRKLSRTQLCNQSYKTHLGAKLDSRPFKKTGKKHTLTDEIFC